MHRTITLFIFLFLFILTDLKAQPFVTIASGIAGVGRSYVSWGDYDNDGDLDVAVCGITTSGDHFTDIYMNSDGMFVSTSPDIPGVKDGTLEWGDFDNDNDLDLLVSGETLNDGNITEIYCNNAGSFEACDAGFADVAYGQACWGDYDRDGDLDVLVTGSWHVGLYQNENGVFTLLDQDFGALQNSRASWGDFDNDGDLDLLLIGDTGGGFISSVYLNESGTFTLLDLGMEGLSAGTADWVDYDNDGDMDISITGFNLYLEPRFLIYTNLGDGTVDTLSHSMEGIAISSVDWGDYDNDGDMDVLMAGKTGCCGGNTTRIYRNDPEGFFPESMGAIGGAIRSGVAWADHDNDGDLDFLLTGMTPSEVPYTKMILNSANSNVYAVNTAPEPPSNLQSELDGPVVSLSWDSSFDGQTPQNGLNYNLRVGTTPGGSDILVPMADAVSGYRHVQAIGNTNARTSAVINNLSKGTYYWSVQAIDQAYSGSEFAEEQSFTIVETVLAERDEGTTFSVFPNPVKDLMYIGSPGLRDIQYMVVDMNGKALMSGILPSDGSINMYSLKSGVYIIKLQSGTEHDVIRLIKE